MRKTNINRGFTPNSQYHGGEWGLLMLLVYIPFGTCSTPFNSHISYIEHTSDLGRVVIKLSARWMLILSAQETAPSHFGFSNDLGG